MKKLSTEESDRYQRSLWTEGFTDRMQEKLFQARILVVGAGGLGNAVLSYCVAAGVGCIGIVDFDVVNLSNLQRQILYTTGDIGKPKADVAAEKIKKINPHIRVLPFNEKITSQNCGGFVRNADVVVDCTDNYDVRYILDAACGNAGKPLVYGTAEQRGGQVSVFHFQGAKGYADLYPEPLARPGGKTGVLSPLPGIIGSIQAMEVIKILTGWGECLSGRLLVFDAFGMTASVFEI